MGVYSLRYCEPARRSGRNLSVLLNQDNTEQRARGRRPLVSRTTILILSAFLIGLFAGRTTDPDLRMLLYLTGAAGLVSYVGLGHLARRRRERSQQRALKKAAERLETRVSRHVPRHIPGLTTQSSSASSDVDRQYIPVVRSQ